MRWRRLTQTVPDRNVHTGVGTRCAALNRTASRSSWSVPTGSMSDRLAKNTRFGAFFTIYFIGSGVSFTVSQFLSARLIFSASFLRHSFVQYFV